MSTNEEKWVTNTRIEVTDEHIFKGKRRDKSCCPVALAVRDHYDKLGYDNPLIDLEVTTEEVYLHLAGLPEAQAHFLDAEGQEFIERFDGGMAVDPCVIYLESELENESWNGK